MSQIALPLSGPAGGPSRIVVGNANEGVIDAFRNAGDWPYGTAIAATITLIEVIGTPLLAAGRFQFALCLVFAAIYSVGLVIVHLPFGWYVVGPGRNGMEYSVFLISSFLILAWQSAPRRASAR